MFRRLLERMTIEVEIDVAGGDGDGGEESQSECVGIVAVSFKVGLEDVQIVNGCVR